MRAAWAAVLAGCAPGPLIDHAAWQEVSAATDPLASHRVAGCDGAAWGLEDGALEASTGGCSYLALSQPAGRALAAGDDLPLVAWHGGLDAEEPAVAHLAILADDRVLWEVEPAIPSEAEVWDTVVTLDAPIRRGATIGVHLHNHGANRWTLLTLGE